MLYDNKEQRLNIVKIFNKLNLISLENNLIFIDFPSVYLKLTNFTFLFKSKCRTSQARPQAGAMYLSMLIITVLTPITQTDPTL